MLVIGEKKVVYRDVDLAEPAVKEHIEQLQQTYDNKVGFSETIWLYQLCVMFIDVLSYMYHGSFHLSFNICGEPSLGQTLKTHREPVPGYGEPVTLTYLFCLLQKV